MKAIDRIVDPVFVSAMKTRPKVELQIGEAKPGEARYAYLSPSQARVLAYALLTTAEEVEQAAQAN